MLSARVRGLFVAVLVACGIGYVVSVATSSTGGGTSARGPTVLAGDGVGPVHFGTSQAAAMARFAVMFGKSTRTTHGGPPPGGCGIDFSASWPNMQVFFYDGKFVGYNTGYSTKPIAEFVTDKGLRIGDTIAQAEKIYGQEFQTSSAQGGSWSTGGFNWPTGAFVYGYLVNPPGFGPQDPIAGITGGTVGCSAMTP